MDRCDVQSERILGPDSGNHLRDGCRGSTLRVDWRTVEVVAAGPHVTCCPIHFFPWHKLWAKSEKRSSFEYWDSPVSMRQPNRQNNPDTTPIRIHPWVRQRLDRFHPDATTRRERHVSSLLAAIARAGGRRSS